MPVAAATSKLRRFRHRFGIRAPKVQVRSHFAWYAYAAGGAVAALALVGLVILGSYLFRDAETRDMEVLRGRLAQLEAQVVQGGGAVTSLEMTNSANRLLADELRATADEVAVLKDDLAYFLRLVPVGSQEGELRLERLIVRPDPALAHRYLFSVLVGYQSGRQPQAFSGNLQFLLTVLRNGKEVQVSWPQKKADAAALAVETRHWQRKDGMLEIAPGDILKRVELRLLQGRQVKASASVNY